MDNCAMQSEGITIVEKIAIRGVLEDIRDNIDVIVACHPTNEYEILDRISDKLTDIILILKKKGGV